ncbi:MAG TPA: HAD family hydrolase [Terriglobales bacterium]|nr:HAD family hydrolase [Terriglobales bacterium]
MSTRAVLFDFGGTLYDYSCLAAAEAESLIELAQWLGIEANVADLAAAQRAAMRQVFRDYLPRGFYYHRDLFRQAVLEMVRSFGVEPAAALLDRFREAQWQRHQRDLVLRPGVESTLRQLRQRGLHVGMVSNIDDDQLDHLLAVAGVRPLFDAVLSSERAGSCKPDPKIYQVALDSAGCAPEEALFVGDTLRQDVAGANRVGLRSVLLWHRQDRPPPEQEDIRPRHIIRAFPEVLQLID